MVAGSGNGQDHVIGQHHALGVGRVTYLPRHAGRVKVVRLIFPCLTYIVTDHCQPAAVRIVAIVPNHHDGSVVESRGKTITLAKLCGQLAEVFPAAATITV